MEERERGGGSDGKKRKMGREGVMDCKYIILFYYIVY